MILVDSDIFLIDLRYPRDRRASQNRLFLERIARSRQGATTVFNLLEVTGILSFNLNSRQLAEFYLYFPRRYGVRILPSHDPQQYLPSFRAGDMLRRMRTRMAFGDALIAWLISRLSGDVEAFVTWNDVHFRGRLTIPVLTPVDFARH